jgi:hypothetical protein
VILEAAALLAGALGVLLGIAGWSMARRWQKACQRCRIIIARKGKVVLDAPLVEWIAWNEALPSRERDRGGVIFMDRGIQVALARPKLAPAGSSSQTTRTIKEPQAAA